MSDPDNCALNPDGTLKDAQDIQFFHSPSDQQPLATTGDVSDVELPSSVQASLKGKVPVIRVGGKSVVKPSVKIRDSDGRLDTIFNKVFTVGGRKTSTASKSNQAAESSSKASKAPRKRARSRTIGHTATKRSRTQNLEDNESKHDGDDDMQGTLEADAPKRKHAPRGQDTRTEDIRALFTKETREFGGKDVVGHICNICRDLKLVSNPFFTGSNTTLRTHISRQWSTHGDIYLGACETLGITPNERACSNSQEDMDDLGEGQKNLDGFVHSQSKWTREGLLDHIIEFIVSARWGSMSDLVNRAILNRAAIDKFCILADSSPKVPNLAKKNYLDYKLSRDHWTILELIQEVLQEPREAQTQFSSEKFPTVYKTLPILEFLISRWENFASLNNWLQKAILSRVQSEAMNQDPYKELNDYLEAPLEVGVKDIVRWWGFRSKQFPVIAAIARDYLATQGSSVPSERAFLSGALTDTLQRNGLSPDTFQALQILKNGYKHGVITAGEVV
ncbi:hypothetical protein H0H87_010965 [Tephrocybe sp. NHM501043]|nr:hypothetical protein H0H87_010965 [Tephrocybe sp. NHM501043]